MLITALCPGHGRQAWAKVRGGGWLLAANCGLTCKAVAGCACGCWLRGLQASHWGQGTAPVTSSHELMMRNVWSHEKVSGSGLFAVFPLSFSSSRVYSGTGKTTLIVHLLAEAHLAEDFWCLFMERIWSFTYSDFQFLTSHTTGIHLLELGGVAQFTILTPTTPLSR